MRRNDKKIAPEWGEDGLGGRGGDVFRSEVRQEEFIPPGKESPETTAASRSLLEG
jgi:hypothetical protein